MKKKIWQTVMATSVIAIIGGGAFVFYLWNMPHRDVLSAQPDYTLSSSNFVSEYLANPGAANEKYLSDDGDSKIVVISGPVASISQTQNGDQVVLIKETGAPVGVAFTFTSETNDDAAALQSGQSVAIKGVVRAGPRRDEFLGLYSNAVIEKASLF